MRHLPWVPARGLTPLAGMTGGVNKSGAIYDTRLRGWQLEPRPNDEANRPVHGAQAFTAARLARARRPSTIRLERQECWLPPRRIRWRSRSPSSLLAALVIGWPWLSGRVTIPWDAKAHFQPQIQFLAQSLARGDSPAWAPFVFSGHPQIADPQAMIFSPPFLVLALFDGAPSLWAVDATVLAVVFLGGAALMLWFRDQGWHWAGGLIAALAFSYGASMAWRIQHIGQVLSLAYLPIAMVCLDRALARGSILYGVAAGVVAACMVLGRDQVALLGIYFLAGLAVWRLLTATRAACSRSAQARCRWRPVESAPLSSSPCRCC